MNKVQLKKDLRVFLFYGVGLFLIETIIKSLVGYEYDWTTNIIEGFAFGLIAAVVNHFMHIYEK